jgi:isocitrate/isopropylmalate dehydrogenase
MTAARKGTLIAGDGIGPEVVSATVRVLEATGVKIEWDAQMAGAMAIARDERTGAQGTNHHSGRRRTHFNQRGAA